MGLHNLDKIFKASTIAVVGASEKPDSIGRAVMTNLIEGGFEGGLFPVNPNYDRLYDRPCFAHIADTPHAPDLAVIAIPLASVPDVIDQCVRIDTKGAVILSAGGRETGPEGRQLEARIQDKAAGGGLRIIGPNCLGFICPASHINASFAAHMPLSGKMAFISQSGAICSAMLDLSLKEKMGFRYFISTGSMLDVDFGDLIDYVGSDPQVSSVLLYIESLTDFRKFMSAARAVSRMKPIVVLKSGRSASGARAAASHTGAMAGDDRIYDAAFRRVGAVRVRSMGDFFDCAELLAKQKPPGGPRLTILTNSGGPGVMAADAVAEQGLTLSDLGAATTEKLDRVLPAHWSQGNPVDIIGDADARRYRDALACLDNKATDGLLIILNPQAMIDPAEVATGLIEALEKQPRLAIACWMGGQDVEKGIDILNQAGIPTYDTPEQAVEAFRYLYDYGRNLELLEQIPPAVEGRLDYDRDAVAALVEKGLARDNGMLTELEAKTVLAAYGIAVNTTRLAESKADAETLAAELGLPLAMKIASPDIVHKSRAGCVRLGLDSVEAVAEAYDAIIEKAQAAADHPHIQGVTLAPMQSSIDVELLMGVKKDPHFGPALLFGWGGVHTEALGDWNIAIAPLNRLLARRLMEGTRVFAVLSAEEAPGRADLPALEEMLVRLSALVVDFPQIKELDINPVAVSKGRPCAVDARIVVDKTDLASPDHLSISPYPERYEDPQVRTDGLTLCIRPIKPEDAPQLCQLFDNLSPSSIHQRFFSPMKSLPRDMLVRFTQIDYDREMALVAIDTNTEQMLGVARVIAGPGGAGGEFAVLVADAWQGKGIGGQLLARTLRIVQERGMQSVWGVALPENTGMAKLARRIGFEVKRNTAGEYEMTIDLKHADITGDKAV
jgi:acetyltransferase